MIVDARSTETLDMPAVMIVVSTLSIADRYGYIFAPGTRPGRRLTSSGARLRRALGVLVSLLLTAPASAVYDIDSSHVPMLSHPDLVLESSARPPTQSKAPRPPQRCSALPGRPRARRGSGRRGRFRRARLRDHADADRDVPTRAGDPDAYVPPEHTYRLAASLAAHDVPHSAHVFAHGPTAWAWRGTAATPRPGRRWPPPGSSNK
jgi:hypothetical protein